MENTLLANGRRIAYYSTGDSRQPVPLVLLHGFCEDSSLWDPVLPGLQVFRILRIDLPGFGASDPPLTPGMDSYVDAVCVVLNELNIPTCILYGHSMGGYVALEFARQHAERLAGLSLIHSHPFADSPDRIEARRKGIELLQHGKKDLYVAQLFPGLFAPAFARQHPDIVEAMVQKGRQGPEAGIIAALTGMIERRDQQDTLAQCACPVQFVLGALDGIIPLEQAMSATPYPAISDVRVFSEIGHMAMFEAPELLMQAVSEFGRYCLRRLEARSSNKTQTSPPG
ncbi:MAG: alpha/beta hydrolase [Bacteroidetes bacterium]|nr:MAG: alpha/beta hydrolase [Bacteroidota bacterium]